MGKGSGLWLTAGSNMSQHHAICSGDGWEHAQLCQQEQHGQELISLLSGLIRAQLEFCIQFWDLQYKKDINKLE